MKRTYPEITPSFEARYWRVLGTPGAISIRATKRNKERAKREREAAAKLRSQEAKDKAADKRRERRTAARERKNRDRITLEILQSLGE